MRLYLSDNEKLNVFELPEKINESFLFSYTPKLTNIETFLNIYSQDNNWYFKNDSSVNINGNNKEGTIIEENKQYPVNIKGANYQFYLITLPIFSNNDLIVNVNIEKFNIGSAQNCDICYLNEFTNSVHAELSSETGVWKITSKENSNVYINNNRITEEHILLVGDIIFINGLKLIWMKKFFKMNNISNKIKLSTNLKYEKELIKVNNSEFVENISENDVSLFKEEDYFCHKPRLELINQLEKVQIDPPPNEIAVKKIPILFSMGSSVGFALISVYSLIIAAEKYNESGGDKSSLTLRLLTVISTILFSILLPKLSKSYNGKMIRKSEEERQKKYNVYLLGRYSEINSILKQQSQNLFNTFLTAYNSFENIIGTKEKLWTKIIPDKDFLEVRLGIGDRNSLLEVTGPENKFTMEDDKLLEKAINYTECSKVLKNVPITFSLCDNFISALVCNKEFQNDYINGLLLQIMNMHSPAELKIVLLTNKDNEEKWDFLKMSPHVLDLSCNIRYFASNEEECKKILQLLETEYDERKSTIKGFKTEINEEINSEKLYSNFKKYYLIITDSYNDYKNIKFIEELLEFNTNLGFSLMLLENNMRNLPNECEKYIYMVDDKSCILERESVSQSQQNFIPEYTKSLNIEKAIQILANIPVQSAEEKASLPKSLTFLDMYNVGNIEQLSILNKWNISNPMESLSAPIGIKENGDLFKLDLHEKFHGPHGLIAGSTGSGKSEFIITYILSMAINYNPKEVQFVLIDYKGGGLAGAFENREKGIAIPHLAGTITNLDTSEMNRTLVSIQSELKRRQRKFNELRDAVGEGTIDIYKYQKYYRNGEAKEPIAHLFIISDEFAELKSQQPDFMDELISTARIGRSLGVHLILATQKPSGVVNDQIWSNSRFKICLKVQTTADSNEMLKKPDAASIKETGRFYLQVGYDELFELGQSAWSGAKYVPSDKVLKKIDDSITIINNLGEPIKTINNITSKKDVQGSGDQLTNIVQYLYKLGIENNLKTNKLWLDSIPAEIYISNLQIKYNYTAQPFIINPIIGEIDDPAAQRQALLTIDFTNTGSAVLFGIQGSGKENFITTAITSICLFHSPSEVNIYIVDFGSETLKIFNNFPQVGDIILSDESEKISNFGTMLKKEMERRKDLFSEYMGDFYTYNKESGKTIPMIFCVINLYENVSEQYPSFIENLYSILKDGQKYGIVFLITTSSSNSIRYRVLQLFQNQLCTKLAEVTDYRFVLNASRTLVPSKIFGRGLVKLDETYEYQTAYIYKKDEIKECIKTISLKLNEQYKEKATPIVVMPKHLLAKNILSNVKSLSEIPVGISKSKLSLCYYDFNIKKATSILCNNVENNINFIYGLIELLKSLSNVKIRVIDVLKKVNKNLGVDVFNQDYDTLAKQIMIELNRDSNLKKISIFIIIGLGEFKNNLLDVNKKLINQIFEKIVNTKNNRFIIFDNYTSFKFLENEKWFRNIFNGRDGIWLGENVETQMALNLPSLTINERKIKFNEIGYAVKNSDHTIIRYVVDEDEKDEK